MGNHKATLAKQVFTSASELYTYGVREVVINPGSRSTPLALASEAHPNIKTWIHPNKRSTAFFAVELIKGSERPVVILYTPGATAADYTPAIAESQISRISLIVLTSDHPHELRSVGIPQAINQVNMFNNYVSYEFDMPVVDDSEETIDAIYYQIQIASQYLYGPRKGPIHFNLPFRDLLTPDLNAAELLASEIKILSHYQKSIDASTLRHILNKKKGLITVGDTQHQEVGQILTYSTIYDLPILTDPLSHLRESDHPNVVRTYDLLFKSGLDLNVDFVIHVGKPVIPRELNQWLKETDAFQILMQDNDKIDVFPIAPDVSYRISASDFFRSLMEGTTANRVSWLEKWQCLEKKGRKEIKHYLEQATDESAFVGELVKKTSEKDTLLISNSMPIRDVDNLLLNKNIGVYASRGANDINDIISAALGMTMHKRIALLIGDLSSYHDMNGLLMSELDNIQMGIVLLNDDGGGIFSYLPQKESATDCFERLFDTPARLDFEYTAKLYQFDFKYFNSVPEFKNATLLSEVSTIYELVTNHEDNFKQHQILYQKLDEMIHDTL